MMRSNNDVLTIDELEKIMRKDLLFQRFIFRRTWVLDYAVWAVVMAYSIIMPDPGHYFYLPENIASFLDLAFGLAIVLIAIGVTASPAKAWDRTFQFQKSLGEVKEGTKRPFRFALWIMVIYLSGLVVGMIWPSFASAIFYLTLVPVVFFVHYSLKRSFSDRIPMEGVLASSVLAISVGVSLFVSIFGKVSWSSSLIALFWSITTIVWFFSSSYALFHAPDELEVLHEE